MKFVLVKVKSNIGKSKKITLLFTPKYVYTHLHFSMVLMLTYSKQRVS